MNMLDTAKAAEYILTRLYTESDFEIPNNRDGRRELTDIAYIMYTTYLRSSGRECFTPDFEFDGKAIRSQSIDDNTFYGESGYLFSERAAIDIFKRNKTKIYVAEKNAMEGEIEMFYAYDLSVPALIRERALIHQKAIRLYEGSRNMVTTRQAARYFVSVMTLENISNSQYWLRDALWIMLNEYKSKYGTLPFESDFIVGEDSGSVHSRSLSDEFLVYAGVPLIDYNLLKVKHTPEAISNALTDLDKRYGERIAALRKEFWPRIRELDLIGIRKEASRYREAI